jgi:glycerol-3-phosphate acyltransferase PlsX
VAFSYDHTEYGGAPLMGINGTCIICHGSASARAIKMALLKAKVQASSSINTEIAKMFAAQ